MFKRQNSKQKIMFRIIALGIIFALLPVQTCLARGRGKCKLAEEVGTGVAMNVLPGAIGLNSQYVTFNQVIMGHVAAPGISAGLAHAGLDDPLANAALTGFLSGGIKGGMLEGGGWQGAFTEGARWATAGATGNYLEQQGLHPGLANLGASAAGNFAGGAMQGILYEKAYNEAGNLKSDWAKKYGTRYELQDKDGHPLETLIEESSSQLRLVEVPRIAATKSMGQGFFGGGWQAVTEPGWSYYIGEGLRSGILQAGYDRKTGETETWAALAAPFVGDGARTLVADIQRKRLAGSPDAPIPDPTLWYGHAIGSLTRAAVSEGIVHIAKKNDLSPQTTGLLTNLATGAMGGFIQAGFRQDGVSLGESVRQGIARGQYPAYRDFMTFGSPEQRFRGINHSLESSLYASRVLDFAQDSWLRKMRRPDGGIETKVGFYYGDVQRSRMTNIFVSQAASNIAIPVRQAFTDQFAIEGKYAEIFEKFIKDPRIPQATKDKFISVAAVHRKQYEALGGEAWERESTFSYKRGLKDISETSFGDFLSSLETDLGRLPAGIEEVTLGKNGKEVVFVPTDSLRTSRKYILRRWRECPVFLDGKKMFVDKDDIFTQVTLANGREAFFLPDKLRTSPSWRWNGFIEGETPEGKRVFINWSDISQPLRAVMTHGPKVERTEEAPDFSAFPTIPDKPVRERVPSYEKYLDSDKIYGDVTESIYYQEAVKDKLLKEGWLFRLDSAPQSP